MVLVDDSSNHEILKEPSLKINVDQNIVKGTKKSRSKIPMPTESSDKPIHVFVDNSNIFIGFQKVCEQQQKRKEKKKEKKENKNGDQQGQQNQQNSKNKMKMPFTNRKQMLSYQTLFTSIIERGRNVARRELVASLPLFQ